MLLRAGLVSLALLLASRVLGLLRESVQAAALGASGLADVAILMLTLPDLLTGILASGALGYVLLPLWARQDLPAQAAGMARLGGLLLLTGCVAGLTLLVAPTAVSEALAPGLDEATRTTAHGALLWSAAAMPLALLAALWTTRLQHLRDFAGLYGANLVVNGVVIAALLWIASHWQDDLLAPMPLLGLALLLAMGLRLAWLRWRMGRAGGAAPEQTPLAGSVDWPRSSVWLWALASAGLPLTLPLVARSLASAGGEGTLTTFNYAWKLVELPLVLAIQLVATLAFPGIARAFASGPAAGTHTARRDALRQAFVLAWVLACAAAAALAGTAPALANLLFGWGRMPPEAVAQIGAWARIGAWSLLPQALLAVLLTLMASTGRLRGAVLAYLVALAMLSVMVGLGPSAAEPDGTWIMWGINASLAGAALLLLVSEREYLRGVLVWRDLLPGALTALAVAWVCATWRFHDRLSGLGVAMAAALTVLVIAWLASPGLRRALRR
jgi:peptidoglycan biosynthesis protein MviN/MurJ (putative lipid II flippase)